MILFQKDWALYPDAIIDYKTSNESFLRMAQVYKSMGVKNNAFHLALMQRELQGVNPHDPHLSQEQRVMIGLECRYNPWYFYREVVRLDASGGATMGFKANRGNLAVFWCFMNHVTSALIQPRQTGKSTSVDCQTVWLEYIAGRRLTMMLLTKDDKLRSENIDRLKGIRTNIPPFLLNMRSDDSDNTDELTCKAYKNKLLTGVARNSEQAANNLGRGLTAPILQCDEGPFITFIGVTLPAALASGTAARDQAKAAGMPYGTIFTTTAGKKDDRDGRYMYDLIHGGMVWDERLFDAPDEATLHKMVKDHSPGRMPLVNITMSHRQLGYTDEWLYEKMTTANSVGEAADRDFLNIWTSGTQRSPLSVALNEIIFKSQVDPKHVEISKEGYILKWYIDEDEIPDLMATGHVVWGADTSEAVGRDAITLVGIDVRTLEVVCAGAYNETNLIRFANYLGSLLVKYKQTTLVIERKSSAQMIIDMLTIILPRHGMDPFKRLYNRIVDEQGENPEAFHEINRHLDSRSEAFYDKRKNTFGFNTNASSRMLLYSTVLQNAAKQGGHLVRDRMLSAEIRGLVEKNGRIDHNQSGHDDMVIAWLLAHWFLTHARNLAFYGIDVNQVMIASTKAGQELSEDDLYQRELQQNYLTEIDELLEKLKETNDEILAAKYELRLNHLSRKVDMEVGEEMGSMDAMIRQASEERRKRQRIQRQQRGGYNAAGNREISFNRWSPTGRPQAPTGWGGR